MTDHADFQVRFSLDEEGSFEGHAVVYAERNRHNELYQRGAFSRTLDEHRANGLTPPMFWSHDPSQVIGVWTDIREDARGLAVRGSLLLDTVRGREVASMLKAKAASGISIGFRARKQTRGQGGVRTILDAELVEISLVALPSANGARVTSYRQSPSRNDALAGFIAACRRARQSLETTK